jgi:hypothetical protein
VIDDNYDNGRAGEQSTSVSFAAMACIKKERIFFFTLCVFFLILSFASSTDLVACSFDHSCKKSVEMEIEKWYLKK